MTPTGSQDSLEEYYVPCKGSFVQLSAVRGGGRAARLGSKAEDPVRVACLRIATLVGWYAVAKGFPEGTDAKV